MSIEMENPQTVQDLIDAAWNHVEQARVAMMAGDRKRLEEAIHQTSLLLASAVEKLEEQE